MDAGVLAQYAFNGLMLGVIYDRAFVQTVVRHGRRAGTRTG